MFRKQQRRLVRAVKRDAREAGGCNGCLATGSSLGSERRARIRKVWVLSGAGGSEFRLCQACIDSLARCR